jgi:DNA-binding NarL/FixJ family response regulator
MTDKKRIIIVDDQDLFREGLIVLLKKSKFIEVIAEARNGKEFLDIASQHNPDAVIMDIDMPVMDGIEASRQALAINPNLKILAISMFWDEAQFFKIVNIGAKGFMLKSSVPEDLEKAILEITQNRNFFSDEVRNQLLIMINGQTQNNLNNNKVSESLTKQEVEILRLIVTGLSKEQIAKKLNIKINIVNLSHENIIIKTSCNNSASLVMFAIKNKLVEGK